MLEFKSLSAGYHGKEILHDINLKLQPGKLTVLIGPNGCGKSTLLRSGAALLRPIIGELLLNNVPLKTMSRRKIAQSLALLPQEKSIPPITAQRLVLHGRFPYLSYPRTYSKEDQQIAADAIHAPVSVMETAGEGGPYGMALLCAYMLWRDEGETLPDYLDNKVFHEAKSSTLMADEADVDGFNRFLAKYKAAFSVEKAAVETL